LAAGGPLADDQTQDQARPQREWLTVNEVAVALRMHPATVRRWAQTGQLPATRIGARYWRVRRSALEHLLESDTMPDPREPVQQRPAGDAASDRQELALTSEDDLIDHEPGPERTARPGAKQRATAASR